MGIDKPRKRMYKLTENGEKTQKTIVESNTQIQKCLENIILSSWKIMLDELPIDLF